MHGLIPRSSARAGCITRSSRHEPRGRSDLQRLFHERFPAFENAYEEKFAADFGRFRLPLISGAAAAFDACGASPVGDWENGIARIRCPDCGYDYFRPFSCKSLFLCPSCEPVSFADLDERKRSSTIPGSLASTWLTTFFYAFRIGSSCGQSQRP